MNGINIMNGVNGGIMRRWLTIYYGMPLNYITYYFNTYL